MDEPFFPQGGHFSARLPEEAADEQDERMKQKGRKT